MASEPRVAGWQKYELVVTELAVLVSVGVIAVRTRFGSGPSTLTSTGLVWLVVLALPALVLVPLTTVQPIRHVACLLALVAWVPVAVVGDLSCVDCSFALLIPVTLALPQIGVFLLSMLATHLHRRNHPPARTPSSS
jgi:hypothetical protein